MMIGECTDNGPHINYLTDALSSIVACVDENLNTTYTAAYKPYGDVLASSGTAPNFTYVGTLGYCASAGQPYAEYLAGARIGSTIDGRWTSVDPLWPDSSAYGYADANPVNLTDRTGLMPSGPTTGTPTPCCCCATKLKFKVTGQQIDGNTAAHVNLQVSLTKSMQPWTSDCKGKPQTPPNYPTSVCTLSWQEKASVRTNTCPTPGTWYPVSAPTATFDLIKLPCGSSSPLTLPDHPGPTGVVGLGTLFMPTSIFICIKVTLTNQCDSGSQTHGIALEFFTPSLGELPWEFIINSGGAKKYCWKE